MILKEGDGVLAVHRRLFAEDSPRFFLGVVDAYEPGVARVTGQSWVKDQMSGRMIRHEGLRTKILALASGTLLVYRLPDHVPPGSLRFDCSDDGRVTLTDGGHYRLQLREH